MSADEGWKASACTGKQSYSIGRARELARKVSQRHDEPMQAYHCPFCHGWHVGRARAKRVEKRRRRKEGLNQQEKP